MTNDDKKTTDTEANADTEAKASESEAGAGESAAKDSAAGIREQLEAGLEEVKSMATELGAKLGAAAGDVSVEAQEGWKKLEPQVKEKLKVAETALGEVTEAAAEQIKGLFGELKSSLGKVKDKM